MWWTLFKGRLLMDSIADHVSPDLDHIFLGYNETQTQVSGVIFLGQGSCLPGV